jgi:hypothetical protein
MKKINVFLLVIIIALLVSLVTVYLIEANRIIKVQRIPMDVRVKAEGGYGVNIDPGEFHFGGLPRGAGGRRELWIHQVEQDSLVSIHGVGLMADWISYPDDFIVKKGEEKNISVSISIPWDTEPGNYTGEVVIVLRKP